MMEFRKMQIAALAAMFLSFACLSGTLLLFEAATIAEPVVAAGIRLA